jgi:hypothetical protein
MLQENPMAFVGRLLKWILKASLSLSNTPNTKNDLAGLAHLAAS